MGRIEWTLVIIGGLLAFAGVCLAVGQIVRSGVFVPEGPLAAFQVHLSLAALGAAVIAGVYARSAFRTQQEQLKLQQEEIESLSQVPKVHVSWDPIQDTGIVTAGPEQLRICHHELKGPDNVVVYAMMENRGKRLATTYEVSVIVPSEVADLFTSNMALARPPRDVPDGRHFSSVVAGMEHWYLLPGGSAVRCPLLTLHLGPTGPLQSRTVDQVDLWQEPINIKVRINGDWGGLPATQLDITLER